MPRFSCLRFFQVGDVFFEPSIFPGLLFDTSPRQHQQGLFCACMNAAYEDQFLSNLRDSLKKIRKMWYLDGWPLTLCSQSDWFGGSRRTNMCRWMSGCVQGLFFFPFPFSWVWRTLRFREMLFKNDLSAALSSRCFYYYWAISFLLCVLSHLTLMCSHPNLIAPCTEAEENLLGFQICLNNIIGSTAPNPLLGWIRHLVFGFLLKFFIFIYFSQTALRQDYAGSNWGTPTLLGQGSVQSSSEIFAFEESKGMRLWRGTCVLLLSGSVCTLNWMNFELFWPSDIFYFFLRLN